MKTIDGSYVVSSILLLAFLSSCEYQSLEDVNKSRKLVLETYYDQTTVSESVGFTSFSYDGQGNLTLRNQNDDLLTGYQYDAQDRPILVRTTSNSDFSGSTTFLYPDEYHRNEISIGWNLDTIQVLHYTFDDDAKPVNLKEYRPGASFLGWDKSPRLQSDRDYFYNEKGSIAATKEILYRYRNNKKIESSRYEVEFDDFGNKTSETYINSGDSVIERHEFINVYEGGLLVESFPATGQEYYYTRYEYDEMKRLVRTYDYNGYLTMENFYKDFLLVENDSYSPDSYDNIPDFKKITLYTYE